MNWKQSWKPEGATVNLDYFFSSPERFPWDYLGIPYPGCGPLYTCLARAAAIFCNQKEAALIRTATLSELRRIAQAEGAEVTRAIVDFVDLHVDPGSQRGKAKLVMSWLEAIPDFTGWMQKKLDSAYKTGVISIPTDALWK